MSRVLSLEFARRRLALRALGPARIGERRRVIHPLVVVERVVRGFLLGRRRKAGAEPGFRVDFRIVNRPRAVAVAVAVDAHRHPRRVPLGFRRVARTDDIPFASRFEHGAAVEIGGGDPGFLFRLGFPMRPRDARVASRASTPGIRVAKEHLEPRANHGWGELEILRDARDGTVGSAEDGRGREEGVIVLAIPRSRGGVLGVLLLLSATLLLLLLRLSIGVRRRLRDRRTPRNRA